MAAAYAHELPKYGLPVGLTNYASCYSTGLLLARRLLKKIGLENRYKGKVEADGKLFLPVRQKGQSGRRPFTALLDVGLAQTTTGARIFAALKGAVDGGIRIPHSPNRFRGYNTEKKAYDAEAARSYIFGAHVSQYMTLLSEHPEKYKKHFSQYIKHGITSENLEETIAKTHAAIRAKPEHKKKRTAHTGEKSKKRGKLTLAQRKHRIKEKVVKVAKAAKISKKAGARAKKAGPKSSASRRALKKKK